MSASINGTISANVVTAAVAVRPNETLFVGLVVANGDEFVGKVRVERSPNSQIWTVVQDNEGNDLDFDGTSDALVDTVASAITRNDTPKRQFYRIVVTGFDGDNMTYELTQVAGDAVEVILRDPQGQPVLSRRDDGGLKFHAPIAGPGEEGDLEVSGPLTATVLRGTDELSVGDGVSEKVVDVLISAADIIATTAGGFGHAAGYPLVAAAGAGVVLELVSAVVTFDRAVAAYTAGGNITINESGGGAALTGLVSAANSLGNAADKVATFVPLAAAATVRTPNTGLNLVASAAFTNPGTAAGVIRAKVRYREVVTGL